MNPDDNTTIRCKILEVDDTGPYQRLKCSGRYQEMIGGDKHKFIRMQPYGLSANPPVGSKGTTVTINGSPDISTGHGYEHATYRPRSLQPGEGKIYDQWGHYLYQQQAKWTQKVGTATILAQVSGGLVHLNPPSSVLLEEERTHRDKNPVFALKDDEVRELQEQEKAAERERQRVIAAAQAKHNAFMARIDALERRIAELEEILAAHREAA